MELRASLWGISDYSDLLGLFPFCTWLGAGRRNHPALLSRSLRLLDRETLAALQRIRFSSGWDRVGNWQLKWKICANRHGPKPLPSGQIQPKGACARHRRNLRFTAIRQEKATARRTRAAISNSEQIRNLTERARASARGEEVCLGEGV